MNAFVKQYEEVRDASLTAINKDPAAKPFSWNPMQVPMLQDEFFSVRSASMTTGGAYISPYASAAKRSA